MRCKIMQALLMKYNNTARKTRGEEGETGVDSEGKIEGERYSVYGKQEGSVNKDAFGTPSAVALCCHTSLSMHHETETLREKEGN